MNLLNKKILIPSALALLLAGCATQPEQTASVSIDEIKVEAKAAIMKVGKGLKASLVKKIQAEGPAGAAAFCSTNAMELTKAIVATLPKGTSVKRITDKPRNIKNMATKEQLAVLEDIKAQAAKGKMPKMVVKQISSNHYQVYKPLVIEKKCLTCHGDAKTRNSDAYNVIKEKFPNDKAINYKSGDLRGAFLVDIIK